MASLEVLTGVMARDTMIGLVEDLLDTYIFVSEHLGIPISNVRDRVHGSTRTHPQPYSSHISASLPCPYPKCPGKSV